MDSDKDLIIQEHGGDIKVSPLVLPASKFDKLMYDEMVRLNKQVKIIKEILEVSK